MIHITKVILSMTTAALIILVSIPFKLLMCVWFWSPPNKKDINDKDYIDYISDLLTNIYNK